MIKSCSSCKHARCSVELDPCLNCESHECWEPINKNPKQPIKDVVNAPSHYNTGSIEVIDYIADQLGTDGFSAFCMGNVIKYVSRYKHKNGKEDLLKAKTYIDFAINYMETGQVK